MDELIAFFNNYGIFIIVGVITLFIVFRRFAKALTFDYLVDGLLSFIDEPLDLIMDFTVVGSPIPWEIGDLIAAVVIFKRYKHITGKFAAFIMGAEALSFGIEPALEMLPGGSIIAAPIGWFFNLFPIVTIMFIIFDKRPLAMKEEQLLGEEIRIAKQAGVNIKKERKAFFVMQKLVNKDWPVEAVSYYRRNHPERRIANMLCNYVNNQCRAAEKTISVIRNAHRDAPPEIFQPTMNKVLEIKQKLKKAQLLEKGFMNLVRNIFGEPPSPQRIEVAMNITKSCRVELQQVLISFNSSYQQWRQELINNQRALERTNQVSSSFSNEINTYEKDMGNEERNKEKQEGGDWRLKWQAQREVHKEAQEENKKFINSLLRR